MVFSIGQTSQAAFMPCRHCSCIDVRQRLEALSSSSHFGMAAGLSLSNPSGLTV
jgi:hypothetical protein